MAQQHAPVKCPSCGSAIVDLIPLSLIESRYYQCRSCPATFRDNASADGVAAPDFDRITQDMLIPLPGKNPT